MIKFCLKRELFLHVTMSVLMKIIAPKVNSSSNIIAGNVAILLMKISMTFVQVISWHLLKTLHEN